MNPIELQSIVFIFLIAMFNTYEFHKHPLSNAFDSKVYTWYSVEVSLSMPWLVVEELIIEDVSPDGDEGGAGYLISQTLLLGSMQQLEHLMANQRFGQRTLAGVWIMTPGRFNGSGGWRMDRAARLWSAESDISSEGDWQEVPLFETESGQMLPFYLCPIDVDKVRNLQFRSELPLATTQ